MTHNKIDYPCICGSVTCDVLCKLSIAGTMKIQIKCDGCKQNYFLKANNKKCSKFFK